MRNYNFRKRNSRAYFHKSVREDIQKNEFVKVIREKLMKKGFSQNSD